MAGRQEVFESSMNAGDSAAWDQQWDKAVEAYMMAVREFPTSTIACNSLGYALFQVGRLEDSLKVYLQAHKLDPDDPLPVERSADVLERMGRVNEAAKQYLTVAEIYLAQRDLEKAISNWERATRITPGLIRIHQKLAMAYERTGQKSEAINEYLKLAFHFQSASKDDLAIQVLERALRLDSKEPRVLNAMTAVRSQKPISPSLLEAPTKSQVRATDEVTFDYDPEIADADARGPIGVAVEHGLALLAAEVFESGMLDLGSTNAIQAIELHRASISQEAIGAYQRAEAAGFRSGALLFNLGALLVEAKRWDEGIKYLTQVSADHTLNAGANHALSLCYIGKKQWREAARCLVNALRLVDLSLALDDDEAGELTELYNRVGALVDQADPITLENFSQRLAPMLTGPDWKRRVAHTRNVLETIISKKGSLGEFKDEGVIESMNRIERYVAQRRYTIAMDEAHQILQAEPDYLAAHLKIAQILMDQSHVEQAIAKYNLIARTYLLRGDQQKASEILNEVIKVAPADVSLRLNLIELLEQQERWSEVLDQYIELAETYYELADASSARTTYDQAIKLAQRTNAPQEKIIQILHKLGEIDLERVDLRGAMRTYQRICELKADDVKARRKLAELNYRLNNPVQGIQEIDQLLQIYARQKRPDLILEVLEEQIEAYPNDMGLRARLGGVYQQMHQADKAVEQFEELRLLQTSAGLLEEAKQTIRRIISLQPPTVAQYQELLQQMGG